MRSVFLTANICCILIAVINCSENTCTKDTDDCTGHYKCVNGQKECLSDYKGDSCTERNIPSGQMDAKHCPDRGINECRRGHCFQNK